MSPASGAIPAIKVKSILRLKLTQLGLLVSTLNNAFSPKTELPVSQKNEISFYILKFLIASPDILIGSAFMPLWRIYITCAIKS